MRAVSLLVLLVVVSPLLLAACGEQPDASAPEAPSQVLALVGDEPITIADFESSLSAQPDLVRRTIQGTHSLRQYLRQMIRAKLLVQEAVRRNLWDDPDVLNATRQELVRLLLERWAAEIPSSTFPDEDLLALMQQNPSRYTEPDRVTFLQVTSVDPSRTLRLYVALRMVLSASAPTPPDVSFPQQAFSAFVRFSETRQSVPRRDQFSTLDADDDSPKALIQAALDTPAHNVTPIVALPNGGASFAMPLEHHPGHAQTLNEARPHLLKDLTNQRLDALASERLQALYQKANIQILDPTLSNAQTLPQTPISTTSLP